MEAFTEETGIKVKHVKQPEEMRMLVPMELAAGRSTADLILTPWIAWAKDLAKEGHLVDLTDSINRDQLMPIYVELGEVDGRVYAAPFKAWAKPGFWYRISFFEEHGLTPPTTWDEFIELLDTLKGIEGIEAPIASGDVDGWPLTDTTEAFLIFRGGPELQERLIAGEVTFTDPEVKAIMEELADLLAKGYFSEPAEWSAQIDKLWMGKYGIYFMGNWMTIMPQVKDVKDLGFFPFPGTKGATGGGDWAIVPKYTEHLEEAKMLVKFLAGPKAQEIQVRFGGFLPTNLEVPEDAFTPGDKAVVDFLATVKVVPDLDDAIGGTFLPAFRDQLKLLWVRPEALESVLEVLAETHQESV
ncbi:TPA: carbohydrate ABC transporter substrate-binding protein [Candidatus Bathyarchaeota archaeon]|nr:carbohydrate ABC transporter substrate-binding protein [Candidatus Bathyarchaeota archaeon]